MTPEHWQRIKSALDVAIGLDGQPRRTYLDRIATEDPDMHQELQSLLAANDQASADFLDRPAVAALPLEQSAVRDPLLGRRLGPYEIVEEIGTGGMGEVYRAYRADDSYRQEVAIKLVRAGQGSHFVLSRLRNERQILANLEHPNITRLLDGGTTQEGVPYLVMELIDGEPIDRYCTHHQLDTHQRLTLFIEVCAAVSYAHQHLVIHRDLKPSNILVTAQGTAKLLDFGIAKILEAGVLASPASATASVMRLFTPAYASPEQLAGGAITTASDVYSLGVVLYELLTGCAPRALAALGNTPRESALDAAAPVAEREKLTSDARLAHQRLPADLRNIIVMATRPQPQRRYVSVEQLATDITHYLNHLPVIARQDTFGYRVTTFVARHTTAVIASALVAVALLASLAITLNEARLAQRERDRSERRFNDARQLANSLMGEIYASIKDLPGATPARQLLVSKALQYLDGLSHDAVGVADLERELATAYSLVGDVQGNAFYANLGEPRAALDSERKALAIRQRLVAANPADPTLTRELSGSYNQIGSTLTGLRDYAGALSSYLEALHLLERVDAHSSDPTQLDQFAGAYYYVATAALNVGDIDQAVANIRRASAIRDSLLSTPGRADLDIRTHSAGDHATAAQILTRMALYPAALEDQQKAVAIVTSLAQEHPSNATIKTFLALGISGVGRLQRRLGRFEEAQGTFRQVQQLLLELLNADPKNVYVRTNLVSTMMALGTMEAQQGESSNATQDLQQALSTLEPLRSADPTSASVRAFSAQIYSGLGRARQTQATLPHQSSSMRRHGLQAACDWYRQSDAMWVDLQQRGAVDAFEQDDPATVASLLASCRAELTSLSGIER